MWRFVPPNRAHKRRAFVLLDVLEIMRSAPLSLCFTALSLACGPSRVLAESGRAIGHVVCAADPRGMGPLRAWWVSFYNASPFWSAVISVVVVVVLGMFLSRVAEIVFAPLERGTDSESQEGNSKAAE